MSALVSDSACARLWRLDARSGCNRSAPTEAQLRSHCSSLSLRRDASSGPHCAAEFNSLDKQNKDNDTHRKRDGSRR